VTAILALASALLVGGADFLGGVTSRQAVAARVAAAAQAVGLAVVIPAALVVGWERVTAADAGWSIGSGLAVGIGLALFYQAMAVGLISVVAPVVAATGALVPVCYALVRGERPGLVALAGIALAIVAIALVSVAPGEGSATRGLSLSIVAGGLFGLFFTFLSLPSDEAGLVPVALSRVGSTVALVALALVTTRGLDPGRATHRAVAAIGVLEVGAAIFLLLALQRGPVSVAAVLASLYPVTTTLLAATLLRERLTEVQLVGVALALTAVVLVSLG
jgi:drug/metabolite transporter (DMT)-like permease